MEEYIRVTAKTVEDAIIEASIQLGTSSDNVEYKIIERETKGFLGIGAKKAVIEAKKKKTDEDIINEVFGEKPKAPVSKKENRSFEKEAKKADREVKKAEKEPKKQEKESPKPEKEASKPEKENKKAEKENRKPEREPKKADKEKKNTEKNVKKESMKENVKENAEAPAMDAAAEDFFDEENQSKLPKTPVDPKEAEERAENFLKEMFGAMDMQVVIKAEYKDDTLTVDLSGDDMGVLIGKRGQTLDSIQYLVSLVVNKGKSSYVRVMVDTENYRNRRKATLENLAKNIAYKVKKTRRPVYLEPMNPYERRIIHSALQNDPYVTTHSEGEEPCRKVVVTLKKRERGGYQNRISRNENAEQQGKENSAE